MASGPGLSRWRSGWLSLGVGLLAALANAQQVDRETTEAQVSRASGVPGGYVSPHAGSDVAEIEALELRDAARDKTLELRVRFPRLRDSAEQAPLPVVVFSHGAGGNSAAFAELSAHWAAAGYVVIHPTHSDSLSLVEDRQEALRQLRSDPRSVVKRVDVMDRRADVILILDRLDEIEQAIAAAGATSAAAATTTSPVARKPLVLDRQRLALAGHSAGAMTTQMLAGLEFKRFGFTRRYPEPRFRAFILVSGLGITRPALHKGSWKSIDKPMLVIAGSRDISLVSDETPLTRRHPFEYAPPPDKYLVFIDGATHGSYAGRQTSRLLREQPPDNIDYITTLVAHSTLAFLDAHVREDEAARQYLRSGTLREIAGGSVEVQHK